MDLKVVVIILYLIISIHLNKNVGWNPKIITMRERKVNILLQLIMKNVLTQKVECWLDDFSTRSIYKSSQKALL